MLKIDVISAYVSEMYSRVNVCSCKCVNLIINIMCRKQTGCFIVSHVYVGRLSCCFAKMPNLTNHVRSMIIGMSDAGMKQKDIAQRLNIHRHTVRNTIRRFRLTGSTAELPRSGRPRITTARDDQYIRTSHLRDRFRSATFTARNLPGIGRRISAQTVRNRLKVFNIKTYKPATKVSLTDQHKRARLAWCTARVHWNHHQWRSVLFTDESPFGIQAKRRQQFVYRRRGERYIPQCIDQRDRHSRGGRLMVWGGFTHATKTPLHIVQGNLTAVQYVNQVIDPFVLPFIQRNPGTVFQQDNARPHAARHTMNHLRANNVQPLPWPAKSPDLNPIEHVWDALDRNIQRRRVQPRTLAELGQALMEEWQRFPQYKLQRLIASMRRRCQACIAAGGGHTRY